MSSLMDPPPGEVANFDNPPNRNAVAWGSYMLMFAVSTLSVGVRTYGSIFVLKQPKPEDFLILLGYGAFIVALWTDLMFIQYPGYFVHTWNVTIDTEIQSLYYVFLFGTFYSIALAMVKVAIPLDWIRVFVPHGSWRGSYFWWGAMGIVVLQSSFLVVIVVLLNVQCIPHEAIWDITKAADAKCIPLPILQKLSASIHLITDFVILILPQRVIWELNLSLKKKLGVAIIFSLGALGALCSIFRLVDTVVLSTKEDVMYFTGPVLLWCTAEMACAFFVACAPLLPRVVQDTPFLRRIFGTAISAATGSGNPSNTGGTATGKGATTSSRGLSSKRTLSQSHRTPTGRNLNKNYSQIDEEDGMPLGVFGRGTNSSTGGDYHQDHHRGDSDPKDSGAILRTTHITVTQGDASNESGSSLDYSNDPFRS